MSCNNPLTPEEFIATDDDVLEEPHRGAHHLGTVYNKLLMSLTKGPSYTLTRSTTIEVRYTTIAQDAMWQDETPHDDIHFDEDNAAELWRSEVRRTTYMLEV